MIDSEIYDRILACRLGVSAIEPAFACVRIAPDPGITPAIDESLLLPIGLVSVAWHATLGHFVLDVAVPIGIHLQVCLPASPTDNLIVDGEPIPVDTQVLRSETHVELAVLPGNRYRFEVISTN
jgi:hypothetical protein